MRIHILTILFLVYINTSSYAMDFVPRLEEIKELVLICTPPQVRRVDNAIHAIEDHPNESNALLCAAGELAFIGINHYSEEHFTDTQMVNYMCQIAASLRERAIELSAPDNQNYKN